jgi:transcriptional regulator with XRE-family HTH domain
MGKPLLDPIVVRLAAARKAQRLSQEALAIRMFMARSSHARLSVLETGRRVPGFAVVRRWARALGFDLALVQYRKDVADATEALTEHLEHLTAELDQTRADRDAAAQALAELRRTETTARAAAPAGWLRETEWACQEAHAASRVTSAPQYRREHAQRQLGRREYLVRREVYAGPWEPAERRPAEAGRTVLSTANDHH